MDLLIEQIDKSLRLINHLFVNPPGFMAASSPRSVGRYRAEPGPDLSGDGDINSPFELFIS
jgi:hypothetical protein